MVLSRATTPATKVNAEERHANLALLSLVGSMAYGFANNQSSMPPPGGVHIRLVVGSMGSAHTGVNTGVAEGLQRGCCKGPPVFYAEHRRPTLKSCRGVPLGLQGG
jgi:hypothetical protein